MVRGAQDHSVNTLLLLCLNKAEICGELMTLYLV